MNTQKIITQLCRSLLALQRVLESLSSLFWFFRAVTVLVHSHHKTVSKKHFFTAYGVWKNMHMTQYIEDLLLCVALGKKIT